MNRNQLINELRILKRSIAEQIDEQIVRLTRDITGEPKFYAVRLEELEMPRTTHMRFVNAMAKVNVQTIGDLAALGKRGAFNTANCGLKTITDAEICLQKMFGYTWH